MVNLLFKPSKKFKNELEMKKKERERLNKLTPTNINTLRAVNSKFGLLKNFSVNSRSKDEWKTIAKYVAKKFKTNGGFLEKATKKELRDYSIRQQRPDWVTNKKINLSNGGTYITIKINKKKINNNKEKSPLSNGIEVKKSDSYISVKIKKSYLKTLLNTKSKSPESKSKSKSKSKSPKSKTKSHKTNK